MQLDEALLAPGTSFVRHEEVKCIEDHISTGLRPAVH